MALFQVNWTAECEKCSHNLGEGFCDDSLPDQWGFDTERCEICNEEACKSCRGSRSDIHKECEEEAKE